MVFSVGDIVKIKKLKPGTDLYTRFHPFCGMKFKVIYVRTSLRQGALDLMYKIRNTYATINLVPSEVLLLKRRGQTYKNRLRAFIQYTVDYSQLAVHTSSTTTTCTSNWYYDPDSFDTLIRG